MSGSEAIEVEKMRHGLDAIEHPFVHVDVDDLRAVVDLLLGHGQGLLELSGQDQFGELGRAGDVGALADVDEIGVGPDGQRLQAAQAQLRLDLRRHARREFFDRLRQRL